MTSTPTVVFDACVLYSAPLRDLVIQVATTRIFQAKWTDLIHDEWIRNLLINRPDLPINKLERLKTIINDSIPDSLVTEFADIIPTLELPDPMIGMF